MTARVFVDYQGERYWLRHMGGGTFAIYRGAEHVDEFDAADTLRDRAVEALDTDV